MKAEKRTAAVDILLLAVIAVAAAARFYGIAFGLPHTQCRPDESNIIAKALGFFSGDLNPHFFNYPTFYMYLLFGIYGCWFLAGKAAGVFASPLDFTARYAVDPAPFHLADRCLSAGLGVLTVLAVYKTARRLFGRRTARVAALFMALTYLHARDSHFGVTDTAMTFLIMCSMVFIAGVLEGKRTLAAYAAAGVFSGLAASTKYSGILLAAPLVAAHLAAARGEGRRFFAALRDARLWLFGGLLLAAFLAGTPYALFDFHAFKEGFLYEMAHLGRGQGIDLGRGWWYHIRYSLYLGMGWPLLALSLAGALLLAARERSRAAVLLAFPLLYYLLSGKGQTVFLRYAIPLTPFLCITAASGTERLGRLAGLLGLSPRGEGAVVFAAAGLALVPGAARIIRCDSLLSREDNRLVAARWIEKNVPAGSSIAQIGSPWGKVRLEPTLEILEDRLNLCRDAERRRRLELRIAARRKEKRKGFSLWEFDPAAGRFTAEGVPQPRLPSYLVIQSSPLIAFGSVKKGFQEAVDRSYERTATIEAERPGAAPRFYDQQDQFFLPFAGFAGVERPGPNFIVYRLKRKGAGR